MTISLLYHTWEQQLIKFTISELSHDIHFPKKALHFGHVQSVFQLHGVSITKTNAWKKIRELKQLTNTIKHGDGDSADKLRKLRPDFFQSEFFNDTDTLELLGSVLLDGYTLKVKDDDFLDYVNSTISFWDEMPERAYADIDSVLEAINK
ncbi:hypothetical protein [Paenibacillus alvei]|uniref:Uncharacterized protein n=1 Tax=Paenibacillus alvei TaxID=44250 RepID=A0A383RK91_PAEAL|nr:hypothetical protein [Paenibacillus alvei]SYX86924.1 conserved protein of unknown function [Paenibacillus alvei]